MNILPSYLTYLYRYVRIGGADSISNIFPQRALTIFILLIAIGIFEGITLVGLVLLSTILLNEGTPSAIGSLSQFFGGLHDYEIQDIMFLVGLSLFFATLLNLLTSKMMLKFACTVSRNVSRAVFYIHMNSLKSNDASDGYSKQIKDIISVTERISEGVVLPHLQLLLRLFMSAFTALTLFLLDPYVFLLVIGVAIAATGVFYRFSKRDLKRSGAYASNVMSRRLGYVRSCLNMKQEIFVSKSLDFYIKGYDDISSQFSLTEYKRLNASYMPRYYLELFIVTIFLFGLVMVATGAVNSSNSVPLIAGYLFASYRMAPLFNNVASTISSGVFHSNSMRSLLEAFNRDPCNLVQSNANDHCVVCNSTGVTSSLCITMRRLPRS